MIAKAEVQLVPEKVGTHVIGEKNEHDHHHSSMKPTRPTMLRKHLADLAAIRAGLSDVRELAPVGSIAADHPLPVHGVTMSEPSEPPEKPLTDRVLEAFQDGKEHRVEDLARDLGSDSVSVSHAARKFVGRGSLEVVARGLYRLRPNGTPSGIAIAAARLTARKLDEPPRIPRPKLKKPRKATPPAPRHDYRQELIEETRTFASVALRDAADFVQLGDLQKAELKILLAQQRMKNLSLNLEN